MSDSVDDNGQAPQADSGRERSDGAAGRGAGAFEDERLITDVQLDRALSCSLRQVLDLNTWDETTALEKMAASAQRFVASSVENERRWQEIIRTEVFEQLRAFPDAPANAGVYDVREEHLRDAYRNCLLAGDVAAVNGVSASHEAKAASVVAIGICLVRYDGRLNSWRTTFLRSDHAISGSNRVQEIRDLLDSRGRRSRPGSGPGAGRDNVTYLLRRGVMAAAERKSLLEKTDARWRMGHGMPAPLELLTGSGSMALIDEMLPVLEQLLLDKTRWVFLLSPSSNFALATLADALAEREIAILQKGKAALDDILERGHFSYGYRRKVGEFARRLGDAIVVGAFRAGRHSPGQIFIAHADHALAAGVLAMADAALQPHRGFPLLLDLAGASAKVFLGIETFQGMVESAYAKAGALHWFAPEQIRV
jgi:hypothetical protein